MLTCCCTFPKTFTITVDGLEFVSGGICAAGDVTMTFNSSTNQWTGSGSFCGHSCSFVIFCDEHGLRLTEDWGSCTFANATWPGVNGCRANCGDAFEPNASQDGSCTGFLLGTHTVSY